MTGTTGSQSDSASSISDTDRLALRARAARRALILDGALPTTDELMSGMPFCRDNLQCDVMTYIDVWKEKRRGEIDLDVVVAAEIARAQVDEDVLGRLQERLKNCSGFLDVRLSERCDVWLAILGNFEAKSRCALAAVTPRSSYRSTVVNDAHRLAFAIGITTRQASWEYDHGDMEKLADYGIASVKRLLPLLIAIAGGVPEAAAETDVASWLGLERPEPDDDDTVGALDALLQGKELAGIVVVPKLPAGGTSHQKEIRKSWQDLAGKRLPLAQRGDVARHRIELVARWPHAIDIIDVILGDLAAREDVRFRPTLIAGEPGSGKSSLARAICDQVGIPCELTSLAGMSDSSAMGTSAQWSTARESTPLQLIKRAGSASVGIIWDEIEKSGTGRHNGSALDALLPMLEPDQAQRYRDLALEVEVDLSAVSHFATANSLEGIPAPIRDRFRILTMPEPGWQHLHVLTRQIVDRIASERGVDSRWFAPLAEDELDLVRQTWPGGSIRKLTTVVRTIIDGRDRLIGRC